jgi:hypothetical protein
MTELHVPDALRVRVTADWEESTRARSDLDGAEFWAAVAKANQVMAKTWQDVRRAVQPDPNSVLGKLLLDAEAYRHSQVSRARDHIEDFERRGQ